MANEEAEDTARLVELVDTLIEANKKLRGDVWTLVGTSGRS